MLKWINMKSVRQVFVHFLQTTTLHGFKYMCSPFFYDRVMWITGACVGACCAGILCAVLWGRFLHLPAILTLRQSTVSAQPLPRICVCLTADRVASHFMEYLSLNPEKVTWLPVLLSRILRRKKATVGHLLLLEKYLQARNLTFKQGLEKVLPPCHEMVTKCRWLNRDVPCDELFRKDMTRWGLCCTMRAESIDSRISEPLLRNDLIINQKVSLVLNCSNSRNTNGCEFMTKYNGEEWLLPTQLNTGRSYWARVTFSSIRDMDRDKVLNSYCVNWSRYSRSRCTLLCQEEICGCADIMRPLEHFSHPCEEKELPTCKLSRMNCIMGKEHEKKCKCPHACNRVVSTVKIESNPLDAINYTCDPMFQNLDPSSNVLLNIVVQPMDSKLMESIPTATWITLMSSLGGVFNLFLGVGILSALEFLYYMLVKLPPALRKAPEIVIPSAYYVEPRPSPIHRLH